MNRDVLLRTQIEEALMHDGRVAADSIAVESNWGIVTLSGCAPSEGAALAAVEVAASFSKCRGVANRQVVRRPYWEPCGIT
jgi:osmotically-inducible protein OsmY